MSATKTNALTRSGSKALICLFVHCFPPAKGGVEYLTGQIKQLLDDQFEVHIITGQGMSLDSYKTFDNYINETNALIHRLELNRPVQRLFNKLLGKIIFKLGIFSPYYFGPILKYTPEVKQIIAASHLIIGTPMPTKMFYDAYLFAKKYHKPLILHPSYHDVSYYNRCPQFQQALSHASAIIYQTQQELDGLIKNYKIDKSKLIQLAYNEYTHSQIKKLTPKKLNPKNITLGFVGQITIRKNLTVFKELIDKYPDYKIVLAGTRTNSSPEIEKMLGKKVKIIYDFTDDQKSDIYKKIDIFINPSHEESLGIVNFEAIYHGLPIIVHSQSAFAEFIKPSSQFSNSDDLHQAINYHLTHPNNQKDILQKYNQDTYRQQLLQLIHSLIQVK